MDVKQLAYFVRAYENGNLTKAAQQLYISQQGLSVAIARLEKEFGSKLFVRTPLGVSPTKEGEFLYPIAKNVVEKISICEDYFGNNSLNSEISVALTYGIGDFCPPLVQEALMNANPKFHIRKILCGGARADDLVENEGYDIGFTINPVDEQKFCAHFLYESRIVFLVNKAHPLAKYDMIDISQMQGIHIATPNYSYKSTRRFFELCQRLGITFQSVSETTGTFLGPQLVKMNPNLATLTIGPFAKSINDPDVKVITVDGADFSWKTYMTYKRNGTLSKAASSFVKFVLQCFDEKNN